MAGIQFTEVQSHPMDFLDVTSLTLDEFEQLVPPFETAFQAHMALWCLDGKPRRASSPCTKPARYPRRRTASSSS